MSRRIGIGVLAGLALLASSACTRIDDALASIPVFAFMRSSPSFDPYEAPRPAPAGSVPFESPTEVLLPPIEPTVAGLDAFAAGPHGQNPFAGEDLLELGRTMFDRHCAVCHGPQGRGRDTGLIAGDGRYPPIAPNLAQPAIPRSDGYLYGMIAVAVGGLMPPYGSRTTHRERWAIVTYLRQLQAQAGTAPGGG